jgi:cardiolipin synthase
MSVRTRRRAPAHRSLVSAMATQARRVTDRYAWWQITLFVIGLVAVISITSALFFAVGDKPRQVETDVQVGPVDSPEFLAALGHLVNAPLERGGTVHTLNNGDETLLAFEQAIRGARRNINVSVFMWKDGTFSDRVLDALMERQRQGVAVRVLLDGLGARGAPDDKFDRLEEAGARIATYRAPRFGKLTRFHRRNHRRAVVVDGEVGFTGGIAVYDRWLGDAQDPEHWRDMMFRLTGPLARSLQAAFVDAWVSSTGELLVDSAMFPPLSNTAAAGVDRFVHHVNSPADDDQSMAYFFLLPIFAARERIYVVTPYFIPDDPLKQALQRKAAEGVDVRLLLPGRHIDNQSARLSAHNHYDDLMQAGVKIYEYRPTFIHSKFMVVDGRWSVIGSPNLNSRSRQLDEENAFGILDRAFAAELEKTFREDIRNADEIRLEEWRRRNPFMKFIQLLARGLDQQS